MLRSIEQALDVINGILWHQYVLFILLAVGILFSIWTKGAQFRSLSHGVNLIRGKHASKDEQGPGAISHFQALSAALSGTVGLGNIAGVAVAVALGGPGAVFWMWVVGLVGMALKTTEVTQAMLFRNVDDPENPSGGAMWVAKKGFALWGMQKLGAAVGVIFCITLIISSLTGGNMFQAWNVAAITSTYFPAVPKAVIGAVVTISVALVIIGGIKRIGSVTEKLVPFMCGLYLLVALGILATRIDQIPATFALIFQGAFSPVEAGGAFLGGTFGYAFLWGMKRALFSNEAGQGSSPIAHSAVRTNEPVSEGVVAGLEPFIDTLIVCSITALVILSTGAWNREAAAQYSDVPNMVQKMDDAGKPVVSDDGLSVWIPATTALPAKNAEEERISFPWRVNDTLFVVVKGDADKNTGKNYHRVLGTVVEKEGALAVAWDGYHSKEMPTLRDGGIHLNLSGAALTAYAFDSVFPGLGMWIVTLVCWLFAISTIITWYYYGEQGVRYIVGDVGVLPFKIIYSLLTFVASLDFIKTDAQLDAWTALGTGVMLFANIPIMLIFGKMAMDAYNNYFIRLKKGEI